MKNMTIKLGYANVKIYECENKACPRPDRFSAAPSWMTGKLRCARDGCNSDMRLVRHVSFVDCPGHEVLMATMLNGAAVMDASILVVAANVPCPQPQTEEHTIAVSVTGMKPLITVQNKIDLVSKTHATENYQQILTHLGNYGYPKNVPIIPTSAVGGLNMDVLIETIARLPTPVRDTTAPAFMLIIRSFDGSFSFFALSAYTTFRVN
jgi:translation initiation factor 2 subunit 3